MSRADHDRRIGISGTHRAGKSTLAALLRDHLLIGEPYHDMAEGGYPFSHPPSLDDFEAQLEHSLVSLDNREPNVLFDRCPVDFLGYLTTHPDAGSVRCPRVAAARACRRFLMPDDQPVSFSGLVEQRGAVRDGGRSHELPCKGRHGRVVRDRGDDGVRHQMSGACPTSIEGLPGQTLPKAGHLAWRHHAGNDSEAAGEITPSLAATAGRAGAYVRDDG